MMETFYEANSKVFDPRGMYIIQTAEEFLVIKGKECTGLNREKYTEAIHRYLTTLQEWENASTQVTELEQDDVGENFWRLFGKE